MSYTHLSRIERGRIALLKNHKIPLREIAHQLGRNVSTISRELKRNTTAVTRYRADPAQALAVLRRGRPRRYHEAALREYVAEKLLLCWSPEQIAGRLPLDFPEKASMRISHSSIYRWLALDLLPQAVELRTKLRHHGHHHGERRGVKAGARELRERSKAVFRRKRFGDWEADTIVWGRDSKTHMMNMTERKSRYTCLMLLRNTSRTEMMRAFSFFFDGSTLPLKTLTSDRGSEFNCHHEFEQKFEALYYFTRPAAPWQKPTVENTNGLVRQFFPRGYLVSELSDEAVAFVMKRLNDRPRKCLGFHTPAEVLHLA